MISGSALMLLGNRDLIEEKRISIVPLPTAFGI
jgi:hypothetical protein